MKRYTARTMEFLFEEAAARNCDLYIAEDAELLLDLDTPQDIAEFNARFTILRETYTSARVKAFWTSKSGNQHMVIDLGLLEPFDNPDFDPQFLQLFLGSDPMREWLARQEGPRYINCLFKPRSIQ